MICYDLCIIKVVSLLNSDENNVSSIIINYVSRYKKSSCKKYYILEITHGTKKDANGRQNLMKT